MHILEWAWPSHTFKFSEDEKSSAWLNFCLFKDVHRDIYTWDTYLLLTFFWWKLTLPTEAHGKWYHQLRLAVRPNLLPYLRRQVDTFASVFLLCPWWAAMWAYQWIMSLAKFPRTKFQIDCVTRFFTYSPVMWQVGLNLAWWYVLKFYVSGMKWQVLNNCLLFWRCKMHEMPEKYKRVYLFFCSSVYKFHTIEYHIFRKEKQSVIYFSFPGCT